MDARRTTLLPALTLALAAGGCASTQIDGQWSDPQRPPSLLRNARVMLACEAPDLVLKKQCEERLTAEIVARNAIPVPAPDVAPGQGDAPLLAAARNLNVRALWVSRIGVAAAGSSPGISIGLGAFGLGGGSVRGGVGLSAPIGGGQTSYGFAMESRVNDVRAGKVVWTAKASTPPSQDSAGQMGLLTRKVFEAADQAQLF